MLQRFILLICLCFAAINAFAETNANPKPVTIRIGVQATGTLAWELAVLAAGKFPEFQIEQHDLANAEAGKIALLSGSVDMIVGDWIWAAKMRSEGNDFSFYPYSTTSGSLMVSANSAIKNINDLAGKRIGIAGGELDKNWLLLQAVAQEEKIDLSKVETVFGAPPLINEQLKQGRIDAALNYWHFGAKLEAQGYRQLINGGDIVKRLGINTTLPTLGYLFKQSWAQQNKAAVNALFKDATKARQTLCSDDNAWQKTIPLLQTDDVNAQKLLRQRYCDGDIKHWGDAERDALNRIYAVLKTVSQNKLTGKSEQLPTEMFWLAD